MKEYDTNTDMCGNGDELRNDNSAERNDVNTNLVTEDELQLPYNEKLEIFKKDAETLYEFALMKGLTAYQIRTCLSPILQNQKSLSKHAAYDSCKSIITLSFVIAVISMLWAVPASRNMIIVHAKLLTVKTIPFWDWTYLYFEDCLINNPFIQPEKSFAKEDCSACIEFQEIDRLRNIDMKMITEDYLYADFPYVVVDGDKNWPKASNGEFIFSLNRLNELFRGHPFLIESVADCEFFSTMDGYENISSFLEAFGKNNLPGKFHVAWENCDPSAAKIFRLLASRPHFIPPFAEASPHNQVVVAKSSFIDDEIDFYLPQQIDSATWLVVLNGEMEITLIPHRDCFQFKCKKSSFFLGEGEAVVVPSRVWNMSYVPTAQSYTLAYSSTLIWDDVM